MGYVAWDGRTYEGTPPDGWHEAADGRWWPIGQGPAVEPAPPPAPPPPPPPPAGPYQGATAVAAPPAAPKQRTGCLVTALIVGLILAVLAVIGVGVAIFAADSDGDESADLQVVERSGAADEVDDVRSCTWVGDEVVIELVNNSSKTSNYIITTAYLDEAGNRVGDEGHFLNSVRPDEQVREKLLAIEEPTAGLSLIHI